MSEKPRIVFWFSAGTASAVNTKLGLAKYRATHETAVARCIVPEEHPDNDRFARECETWFDHPILNLKSTEYESCEAVWRKRRYMAGVKGAPCTIEMKKAVRWAFEESWHPDSQGFGYTAEEGGRAEQFRQQNPEIDLVTMLIQKGLTKQDCHAMVSRAGIEIPAMYRLGFNNANCIGCVKAQSPAYWAKVRLHFPDVFEARATLSRELGVRLIKGTSGDRLRSFLDELPADESPHGVDPSLDCSLLCQIAESGLEAEGLAERQPERSEAVT